jgi:acyl-coenzyme A synthetase/AMP-(fatty) acid ligase
MNELLPAFEEDRVIAWRNGTGLTQGEFLADVLKTADRLPNAGFVLNVCEDRYNFLVAFGAAAVRNWVVVLPHTAAPDALTQIGAQYPSIHLVYDAAVPPVTMPATAVRCFGGRRAERRNLPSVAPDHPLVHAFTSGSTGIPQASTKTWRALTAGARQLVDRAGDPRRTWQSIVSTVPSGHSYGLEVGIVPALMTGCATYCGRPLFPADVGLALERVPAPRCLVTTPLHLKALVTSSVSFPPIGLMICATAPLPLDLAQQAETRLGARVFEIYGCTESGYVATRWTTADSDWLVRDDMRLEALGGGCAIVADFLQAPVTLADVIETEDYRTFRLIGRSTDMLNIAGKRASLAGLGRILVDIEGVRDGVFIPPANGVDTEVQRLVAVVVAPGMSAEAIRNALRGRIDPAFVPKRVILVDQLPRNETGKLPLERLRALLKQTDSHGKN